MHPTCRTIRPPLARVGLCLLLLQTASVAQGNPGPFSSEIKLIATDTEAFDRFGSSIAIHGNTVIVGSPRDDGAYSNSGSAYLFNASTGTQRAKLTLGNGAENDEFGTAVAVNDKIAVVATPYVGPTGTEFGDARVFDVQTGIELVQLAPTDPDSTQSFGAAVAIRDDMAIVGAIGDDQRGSNAGAAYVFDVNPVSPTFGNQLRKLTALDGAASDNFGQSVAISGGLAIIGSPYDDDHGTSSGSAYLFDVTTGVQLRKLTAHDAAIQDYFGRSVGMSGGVAIVGAWGDDDDGGFSGSAYLFDADPSSPTFGNELMKLTASDASGGEEFGWSVASSEGIGIVGAFADNGFGNAAGSVYLFDLDPSSPTFGDELMKIVSSDIAADDVFGYAVAIDQGVIAVGARSADDVATDSGAAYVFVPEPSSWTLGVLGLAVLNAFMFRSRRQCP